MVMRSIAMTDDANWRGLGIHFGTPLNPRGGYRMFSQKLQIETYGEFLRIAGQTAGSAESADLVEIALFDAAPKGRRSVADNSD
jgi:hypothetical protein